MNKGNARTHTIKKCKSAVNRGDYSSTFTAMNLIHEYDYVETMCSACIHDDFGYCGFRNDVIDVNKMQLEYCIPAFLKSQE